MTEMAIRAHHRGPQHNGRGDDPHGVTGMPAPSGLPTHVGTYAGGSDMHTSGPNAGRYATAHINTPTGVSKVPFVHSPGNVESAFGGNTISASPTGIGGSYEVNRFRQ